MVEAKAASPTAELEELMVTRHGAEPLGVALPADELLHAPAPSGHFSATETSYYGFNIPDAKLNGEIYIWFHPVLKVMSASVYIWKGLKDSSLACEYVNHYHYLPYPDSDIGDYEIPLIGLKIKVIHPLEEVRVLFEDVTRNVSFDLTLRAIMPAAVRPGGFHFTQACKTTGELNLYGEKLKIDGYFSRDRSWSQERRETSMHLPPVSWMVGVVDETFAFHFVGFDSEGVDPEVTKRYPMGASNLMWGYIFRDGVTVPLVSGRKLTKRAEDGISPDLFELELTDADGEIHPIKGSVEARMPWQTWQNMNVYFCLTRWETARGIGWGDTQDIQYNDFVHRFGPHTRG